MADAPNSATRVLSETRLTAGQLARRVPAHRGSNSSHPSRVIRWLTRGVRGRSGATIRLEGCRVGGTWWTSAEAYERFVVELTADAAAAGPHPTPVSPGDRRRASEAAGRELERVGI